VNHKLGARLQQVRRERHLFQRDLETALSLGPGTISQYERGRREPGFDLMVAIADYLDVSVDYLLGRPAAKPESPLLAAGRTRLRNETPAGRGIHYLTDALRKAALVDGQLFSVERIARRSGVTVASLRAVLEGHPVGFSARECSRVCEDLGLALTKNDSSVSNGSTR